MEVFEPTLYFRRWGFPAKPGSVLCGTAGTSPVFRGRNVCTMGNAPVILSQGTIPACQNQPMRSFASGMRAPGLLLTILTTKPAQVCVNAAAAYQIYQSCQCCSLRTTYSPSTAHVSRSCPCSKLQNPRMACTEVPSTGTNSHTTKGDNPTPPQYFQFASYVNSCDVTLCRNAPP